MVDCGKVGGVVQSYHQPAIRQSAKVEPPALRMIGASSRIYGYLECGRLDSA